MRLLSKAEVLERVGRTFPTIWQWMREGRFPPARDLGGRPAWVESEVTEWIKALPIRKLKEYDAQQEKKKPNSPPVRYPQQQDA